MPCSMCRSRGIVCTPSYPDPHKPRKKRLPERELLDRVQRYEQLLGAAGIDKDLTVSDLEDVENTSSLRSFNQSMASSKRSRISSTDSKRGTWATHQSGVRTAEAPPTPPGTAAIDPDYGDIESIFESVPPLQPRSQHQESNPHSPDAFSRCRHAAHSPAFEGSVSSIPFIYKHLDLIFPDEGSKYFNLDDHCPGEPLQHPETSIMFRLLHVYEQNIHPLVKVVHVPTVREHFCDISADPSIASAHDNALLFAIYTIAISSLLPDECVRLFGSRTKEVVWEEFRRNAQTALCRARIWVSSHISASQAYLLYTLALTKNVDPRSYGVCSGSMGRVVQRLLSLHNKSSALRAMPAPIEVVNREMGIRLWWEVLACDLRACEKSGIATNPTLATATTVLPCNVADSDLGQLTLASLAAVPAACPDIPITDCLFLLLRCEFAQFQLHPPWSQQHPEYHLRSHLFRSSVEFRRLLGSSNARPNTASLAWRLAAVDVFDAYITRRYFDRPDAASSTLVQYARHHACAWVNRIRLLVHLSQRSSENDVEVIQICIVQVEATAKLLRDVRFVRFQWYTYQQLPFFSYFILLDLLRRHTTGKLVDEAWSAIAQTIVIWQPTHLTSSSGKHQSSLGNRLPNSGAASNDGTPNIHAGWEDKNRRNPVQVRGTMLATLMVAAWEKRAQALTAGSESEPGYVPEEPAIVAAMRDAATVFASDCEASRAPGHSDVDCNESSASHAGGSRNNRHQPDAQSSAGMAYPAAFTGFLDPDAQATATASEDMLDFNSLLQSSVDLDWSSWFSQGWTPTVTGLDASPTNFIPSL
ncbi:hypothetical protein EX895_003183 [Sporisorium graminicola]|uniref:Xylanolytic transcriptional activator regulatory domain-containing protein n=1 Tax=Sporisorium graminicola TaxID=280036 RepID=A0A4U7KVB9_9BASI|nr:hypothetical protein EX895_003183 [Sporisorium graminicola]TKY88087.1 hypothetical protein EX895_003183 [Sporisorium graminicola]